MEWAGAHDFVGLEEQAIPLYRAALARGVDGHRRDEGVSVALTALAPSLTQYGTAITRYAADLPDPG